MGVLLISVRKKTVKAESKTKPPVQWAQQMKYFDLVSITTNNFFVEKEEVDRRWLRRPVVIVLVAPNPLTLGS